MSNIDDWAWKVIRSCGLSTANADINVFALHENIKEMLKPRELTDEEIRELYHSEPRFDNLGNFRYLNFARAILKKASEK